MTRHRRGVSRNATRVGLVLVIVLLSLAPTVLGRAATCDGATGRAAWTGTARHVSCVLAAGLSTPEVGKYADAAEAMVRALGVDVPPHAFARWVDGLGRAAAHYCEKGA